MGLLDDIAFTLLIHFPLLRSMYFGVVLSARLHDPSPNHHFNKKYVHNVFLDTCAVLGLVELFWDFLPALWTNSVKKYIVK